MKYCLIGKPLVHSFSADYFNRKFAEEKSDNRYFLSELDSIEDLPHLLKSCDVELGGFNVTAPYKQSVIVYLDEMTDLAVKAGSVNCVRRNKDGGLIGHNTDVEGFTHLLKSTYAGPTDNKKALIIGGGGVVGAVLTALDSMGIESLIALRDPSRFKDRYPLIEKQTIKIDDLSKDDILGVDFIINCTPLGTFPDIKTAPKIPYEYIQHRHVCLDLVYNPEETTFSRICKAHGAKAATGLPMLISQAEAAWKFWNDN